MTDYDLIVLGLGPGGEDVAEAVAKAGWSVLGIDERLVGGECPYYGCIPSKMMLRGAELLAEARRIEGVAGYAERAAGLRAGARPHPGRGDHRLGRRAPRSSGSRAPARPSPAGTGGWPDATTTAASASR